MQYANTTLECEHDMFGCDNMYYTVHNHSYLCAQLVHFVHVPMAVRYSAVSQYISNYKSAACAVRHGPLTQ